MTKKIIFWLPFLAVFSISYASLYYDYNAYSSENIVYVPLNKGKAVIENDNMLLDFKKIIELSDKNYTYKGRAVVYINSFNVASFVRLAEAGETIEDLSFGEQFLQYNVYRKPGLNAAKPSLYFVKRFFIIPKTWKEEDLQMLDRARYAAYLTNKNTGKAAFIGLVDNNWSAIKPRNQITM